MKLKFSSIFIAKSGNPVLQSLPSPSGRRSWAGLSSVLRPKIEDFISKLFLRYNACSLVPQDWQCFKALPMTQNFSHTRKKDLDGAYGSPRVEAAPPPGLHPLGERGLYQSPAPPAPNCTDGKVVEFVHEPVEGHRCSSCPLLPSVTKSKALNYLSGTWRLSTVSHHWWASAAVLLPLKGPTFPWIRSYLVNL